MHEGALHRIEEKRYIQQDENFTLHVNTELKGTKVADKPSLLIMCRLWRQRHRSGWSSFWPDHFYSRPDYDIIMISCACVVTHNLHSIV